MGLEGFTNEASNFGVGLPPTWWMTVETFVRILTEFRDMAPTSPDFADYQTFVFKGILPCFTSYLPTPRPFNGFLVVFLVARLEPQ